jgi:4-hydroxy-tetrahydrodipicolinate reductase
MGRYVVSALLSTPDLELVGAVDPAGQGHLVTEIDARAPEEMRIHRQLAAALEETQPEVMVDFTSPAVVRDNVEAALNAGVACVVGTTGLSDTDLQVIDRMARRKGSPCFWASNFSLGANLMMRFAEEAATSFDHVEIIERHHEHKQDAPSGTALHTAERIANARRRPVSVVPTAHDKAPGSRGGTHQGITVHAVRLPGYVANQEVIFGGTGEILRVEHATTSRECFMPGVILAVRRVRELEGLVVGLDNIM